MAKVKPSAKKDEKSKKTIKSRAKVTNQSNQQPEDKNKQERPTSSKRGRIHKTLTGKAAGLDAFLALKPVDRKILMNYIDENSPTYNNGTQSVKAEKPNYVYGSAAVKADRLLNSDHSKEAILETLEKNKIGFYERMSALSDIMHGDAKSAVETNYFDSEGKSTSSVKVSRSSTPGERLKAIDIINKVDGTYKRAELAKEALSLELKTVYKRFMPELRKLAKRE